MKISRSLAMLLLVGLFGSSCATVSRLNAEYEEESTREMARFETMNPTEKAEYKETQLEQEKINWNEYSDGSD